MKKLALVAAMALCYVNPSLASTDPALQESLIATHKRADLWSDESGPFQLDVDFVVQLNVPTRGHLSLKWEKKDLWWRNVVLGAYQQTEVKDGEWHYTKRNAGFTPLPVESLINLLSFGAGSEKLVANREKRRTENGIELKCIRTTRTDFPKESPHEICLNRASNEILVDEWQEAPDEKRREQFDDYFDFGSHRYPRRLDLLTNGSKDIAANVTNLVVATFEPSLFAKPQGAIARRECNGLKYAIPIKTPDPVYPKSASVSGLMGDSTVAMTVLTDGSVANIQLVGRATRSMDDVTLETLKGWKFKPAMCGSEPVVTDITVIVSFRITN